MSFASGSPAVFTREIDLTGVVPASPSSVGAIAGAFTWGPVLEINTFANEIELLDVHGKPNNDNAVTFLSAANFLSYSGALRVVRVVGNSALNATTGATGLLINNADDYTTNFSSGTNPANWIAKFPGNLGNSLAVSYADYSGYPVWSYRNEFDSRPGTSTYAALYNPNANDEFHIVVVDEDGLFTGVPGQVLERFGFVSKDPNAKTENGESNYYVDVVNRRSRYIWWGRHTTGATGVGTAWGQPTVGSTGFATLIGATGIHESLNFGVSDDTLTSGDEIEGYDLFKNNVVEVDLVISGAADPATCVDLIDNLAEVRQDLVVFLSPDFDSVVNNLGSEATDIIDYKETNFNPSSYVVMDNNWKYQYDKYNDVFRWVPLNADIAGLCARTDFTNDPWFSPAGPNRGLIKNVTKLAWNPGKPDRDSLYRAGINSVVQLSGLGVLLYGDKTMLSRPSAFDRINVRRLFIILKKSISTAAQFTLFEFNDAFTRANFVAQVEPFLRDIKGRRGIQDFRVVCDETNNTAQVINTNSFVGDIYVRPNYSINYIRLNFIGVRSGIEFSEIVGF